MCFIPKTIGISDDDDFIDSDDRDYVMRRIREKYLTDSTVTIVLIGKCTAKRKYVDWEIASTLRNDPQNKRSGLLGINLRSIENRELSPPRLDDNLGGDDPYAIYKNWYPRIGSTLARAMGVSKMPTSEEPPSYRPTLVPSLSITDHVTDLSWRVLTPSRATVPHAPPPVCPPRSLEPAMHADEVARFAVALIREFEPSDLRNFSKAYKIATDRLDLEGSEAIDYAFDRLEA